MLANGKSHLLAITVHGSTSVNEDCQVHAAIEEAVQGGENVNEVEGAGNTPLHCAAYDGWIDGAQLLLSLGAKVSILHLCLKLIGFFATIHWDLEQICLYDLSSALQWVLY